MARKHPQPKRPRRRRGNVALRIALSLFVVVALALLATVILVRLAERDLPDIPSFSAYARDVPKVSRILARDGTVIAEFFTERRTLCRPDSIPPLVEQAVLAAEDADFHAHEGLSYGGIARAMFINLYQGQIAQGGSTITQQVVKQVMLSTERTWQRKFRELLLARLLEHNLTKREILAMYLSEVYLGHGRYGIEEAARYYFGKGATNLLLPEAALLAGIISAPEAHSPVRNPSAAFERQHYVLRRMVEEGMIAEAEAKTAAATPVTLWARPEPRLDAAPYFVDAVRREATRLFGPERLLHDGLTVLTTLDLDVSDRAEFAVSVGLKHLWERGRTRESDEASNARDGGDEVGPPPAVLATVTDCDRSRGLIRIHGPEGDGLLDPTTLARRLFTDPDPYSVCRPGSTLPVMKAGEQQEVDGQNLRMFNAEIGPQAAMVVLAPGDRAVLALVGGEDFASRSFNRAVQSRRPLGSTVKPFLYATAMAHGVPAEATFDNTPVAFRAGGGRRWTPRNYEGTFDGRSYTMSEALARSVNVVAVKVAARIGVDALADFLASTGIDGALPRDLSLALGSAESSPLALANALALFASGGLHDTPFLIDRVINAEGIVILDHQARPSRKLPESIANSVRAMMRRAVTEGTASAAASLSVPAWGKTGTTNRSREAWFAGSDGRNVVTVLVGYDDRLPMARATGGNTALTFFNLFVKFSQIPGVPPAP